MPSYTIQKAKANLSKLIKQAEEGEEVLIMRGKTMAARIVAVAEKGKKRRLGILRGKLTVGPEFFEPLPDEELDLWYG